MLPENWLLSKYLCDGSGTGVRGGERDKGDSCFAMLGRVAHRVHVMNFMKSIKATFVPWRFTVSRKS